MDNRLQISRILHAGYIFQAGSTKILFDPIFENPFSVNCFAFPETRFDIKEIKSLKADAVFISHFHEDHCSFESLQHLDRDIPIYMFCVNPEMFDLIKQLGFSSVQSVELEKPLYIHGFTITPHRALDVEVDCIYQIQYQDIQVLNVVDSWIVDEKLQELIKISWDLILWPFQTMRELEVLSPGTDLKCSPEIPQEWLSQIQALNPKALVPSSCQFKFEKNSWYNSYFFPISYRFFEDELKRICPDTAFMCLNPGKTWLLDKTQGRLSFQDGLDVSWIKISGDENEDYAFNPSVEIPSLQSLARNDPALSIKQLQDLKAYCTKGILQRYAELDPDVYPYFFKERIWLLKVYLDRDICLEFTYRIKNSLITHLTEAEAIESPDWITEITGYKCWQALYAGESLTSIGARILPQNSCESLSDLIQDPLLRCLYDGKFASYQKAQLKRILEKI